MEETHQGHSPAQEEHLVEKALHAPHHTSPSLLVIGTETGVFDAHSAARTRILSYMKHFGETHVIVLCRGHYRRETVGNVTFHPTNSWTRFLYGTDALLIAAALPRPDIVSAQDPHDCGMLALWIAWARRARLHVQVHSDVFADAFKKHSLLNALRAKMAAIVLKRANGIRVVSEKVKHSIEARLTPKREIAVLPIFVDTAHFKAASPGALAERFRAFSSKLLWVGRFEAEKNALLALEAFASAAPHEACLIFLGKGSGEASLRARARALGVHERVFLDGVQDPAPYYAVADLVLLTSDYEGYGRVIIEALAAGKPVLSTDVGIAPEQGVMIAHRDYADALARWFEAGPRTARLADYPYRDFTEYVSQYCSDIKSLV